MEYRLEVNEQERVVWGRLGVSAGAIEAEKSAISFLSYEGQQPTQGIINPDALTVEDFVKHIHVHGSAEDQIRHLLDFQNNEKASLEGLLNEQVTSVDVELLDLRTQDSLEHTIEVTLSKNWSAPCQIHIEQGESL